MTHIILDLEGCCLVIEVRWIESALWKGQCFHHLTHRRVSFFKVVQRKIYHVCSCLSSGRKFFNNRNSFYHTSVCPAVLYISYSSLFDKLKGIGPCHLSSWNKAIPRRLLIRLLTTLSIQCLNKLNPFNFSIGILCACFPLYIYFNFFATNYMVGFTTTITTQLSISIYFASCRGI